MRDVCMRVCSKRSPGESSYYQFRLFIQKVVNVAFKSGFVSFLKVGDRVCFAYKSDFNLSNVYGDCKRKIAEG